MSGDVDDPQSVFNQVGASATNNAFTNSRRRNLQVSNTLEVRHSGHGVRRVNSIFADENVQ